MDVDAFGGAGGGGVGAYEESFSSLDELIKNEKRYCHKSNGNLMSGISMDLLSNSKLNGESLALLIMIMLL